MREESRYCGQLACRSDSTSSTVVKRISQLRSVRHWTKEYLRRAAPDLNATAARVRECVVGRDRSRSAVRPYAIVQVREAATIVLRADTVSISVPGSRQLWEQPTVKTADALQYCSGDSRSLAHRIPFAACQLCTCKRKKYVRLGQPRCAVLESRADEFGTWFPVDCCFPVSDTIFPGSQPVSLSAEAWSALRSGQKHHSSNNRRPRKPLIPHPIVVGGECFTLEPRRYQHPAAVPRRTCIRMLKTDTQRCLRSAAVLFWRSEALLARRGR